MLKQSRFVAVLLATTLAGALDHLSRDHSPLDWARTQIALAQALQCLGEASADERAYEQAVTCYDRANMVLKDAPSTPLRGLAAGDRIEARKAEAVVVGMRQEPVALEPFGVFEFAVIDCDLA